MRKLILALLLISCSPNVLPPKVIVKDSIRTEIKYRDVLVNVPGETIILKEPIECPDGQNPIDLKKKIKGKKSSVDVDLKDGKLTVTGNCDSLNLLIQSKDSIINSFRSKEVIQSPKIEYRTRNIDLFCRWFTGLFFAFLSGYAFFKLKPDLIGIVKKIMP